MLYRAAKRIFDLLSSLMALIVLSPVFLAACVGIKASSRGPVFYNSIRMGKDNVPFRMYKFRSMHVRREGAVESKYLVNEQRIFPFGRFIRKSKIDELPQLVNVLKGDMSVVGPRPYPEKFVRKHYTGDYSAVMSVKPGLACLDSLFDYAHGELFVTDEKEYAAEVLPVRTELAKMYVEQQGIGTDLRIIFRTVGMIFAILTGKKTFPLNETEQTAIKRVRDGARSMARKDGE